MINVLQISRMTIHNGPGLRTNVHFMGCPLNCRWCSTPESQDSHGGLGFNPGLCIGCGACVSSCPTGALTTGDGTAPVSLNRGACTQCLSCVPQCFSKALWQYGTPWEAAALAKEILKDRAFFENSGGGVTFSGGEPLLHADQEMETLYQILKEEGIQIGVDTCGCVPWQNIQKLRPYTDFYLWDLKHMDPAEHRRLTGGDLSLILDNLKRLDDLGAKIIIRYPLIPDTNDAPSDLAAVARQVKCLRHVEEVHLLPFHHMGKNRYQNSGRPYPMEGAPLMSRDLIIKKMDYLQSCGIPCRIVG